MSKLSDADIVALLQMETQAAQGYAGDVQASQLSRANNLYFNISGTADVPAAPEGRSQAKSYDVADVTHSLLAQMAPMIRSSLVEFVPDNEQDENQAQLETDFVRDLLERNDAYTILNEAFFDGIQAAAGWIKSTVETRETVEKQSYAGVEDLFIAEITKESPGRQVEITDLQENEDGSVDIDITVTVTDRRLVIESVAPENMLHTANTSAHELKDIRFVAERRLMSVSELIGLGLTQQQAETVPKASGEYWAGSVSRQGIYQDKGSDQTEAQQEGASLRECWECYYLVDLNENGRTERWKYLRAGDHLVEKEEYSHVPYVTGSMVPIPHRLQGQGVADMFGEIQTQKTTITRQFLDNLAVANRSRLGYVEGNVNLEHLTDGRVNGCVAITDASDIVPLPSTDIGPQCIQGLNYLDTVRTQRGGGAVNFNDAEMQLAKSSTEGALGLSASKEMMAGWYGYNLVNTLLKNLYLLVHRCAREYMPVPMSAKINGRWVQTNPGEWAPREYVQSVAGLTESERRKKTQALSTVISNMQGWIAQGANGILTDYSKLHQAQRDWLKINGVENPDVYLIDPESPEAIQAAQRQAQMAQQQQQKVEQQQMVIYQLQKQIEDEKIRTDRWKHETELRFKYFDTLMDANVKEAEITAESVTEAAKLATQSGNGADRSGQDTSNPTTQ